MLIDSTMNMNVTQNTSLLEENLTNHLDNYSQNISDLLNNTNTNTNLDKYASKYYGSTLSDDMPIILGIGIPLVIISKFL